jgi:hypothetical protein
MSGSGWNAAFVHVADYVAEVPESDIQPGFPVLVVARFEGLAKAARRNFLSPGPHDR